MTHAISEDHPLRRLFRGCLEKAFQESSNLYSPEVAAHIEEDVLCDFIHSDRVWRLKDSEGQSLEDIPQMLELSGVPEGPERRLEVDGYIGDFALFMSGFFPAVLTRNRWLSPTPLVSKVGKIFVRFEQPFDYFVAEGRNAYRRAASTARLFAPRVEDTYSTLADRFELYQDLLRRVKALIAEEPEAGGLEELLE